MRKHLPRYLRSASRSGKRVTWKWEPSKALREAGWTTKMLGDDLPDAINAAKALNKELDAWRQGVKSAANDIALVAPIWTKIGDLIHDFDNHLRTGKAPKTNKPYSEATIKEYRSRLKWIKQWADDGKIKVRDIDRDMIEDLRDTLVEKANPFTAAAILRVLSTLFSFAEKRRVISRGSNPCRKLDIPTPPTRTKRCTQDVVHGLVEIADELGFSDIGTGIALGFYTTQREADLLKFTRFHYVDSADIAPQDRAELAGTDGEVRGFNVRQNKTGEPIIAFVPPWLRARIDEELRRRKNDSQTCTHIIRYPETIEGKGIGVEDRPCPDWKFQRCYRLILECAIERAQESGNNWLIDQLTGLKFSDMRRSGMCWMRDLGVTVAMIAAISGHSINYTQRILDTYMPGDPRSAAAGLALALRNQAKADERSLEKKKK